MSGKKRRTDDCPRELAPGERRPVKAKHKILNAIFPYGARDNLLLDGLEAWLKTTKLPGGKKHPLVKPANNYFINLPVNIDLKPESEQLPPDVVRRLIQEAKYIHILDRCLCRHGRDCKQHRHDLGCMFLGASGLDVVPQFSREATKEEALAHLEAGLADGLMPMAGRIKVDNIAFLLPDHRTLIGICLCCDCCCFMSFYKHAPVELVDPIYHKLPGARLGVDKEKCAACTTHECVEHCYMDNITIAGGLPAHSNKCRACGRCARYCSHGAIDFWSPDPDCVDKTFDGLFEVADLVGQGTGDKPLPY
ncbi:MAG: DUF362 domain-containing protein [Coriobacteriia bacterium]